MKIAVYGDSFACINTRFMNFHDTNLGPAWVELLEDESNHKVTNFAEAGTAFMFSYEKFLNNYNNFDINIFVVTNHYRTYVKALDGIKMFGIDWVDIQKDKIKKSAWYPKRDVHLQILDSVRVYLSDWADWNMNKHIQHVLVNNLWNLKSNTIVIPGFDDSVEQTTKNINDCAYHELSLIDPIEFEKNPLGKVVNNKAVKCKRKCHFSDENNRIIYELIDNAIKNEQKLIELDKSMIVKPKITDYYHFVELADYI